MPEPSATVGNYKVWLEQDPDPDFGPVSWVITDTRDDVALSNWTTYRDAITEAMELAKKEREAARSCEDCADKIERHRGQFPYELPEAALHIAVGALYGGSACDHVDRTLEDEAAAFEALWGYTNRERDRLRAGVNQVQDEFVAEFGMGVATEFLIQRLDGAFKRAGLPR